MLIAQISDTHIMDEGVRAYGVLDTAPYLARAVAKVMALDPAPDVVLVTGDLVDRGLASEYERLRGLLAPLTMPVYVIPGNHDKREPMRETLGAHYLPRDGFLHYAIDDHPVRLVGLDTIVPGSGAGALCDERLAWIERTLAAQPDKPTMLFMHHPPFRTHIAHMDAVGLAGIEGFARVLKQFDHVERVTCGHVHRAMSVRFGGTVVVTSPSTAHQVVLDIRPEAPSVFDLGTPGFMLHHWDPAVGLRSHVVLIGAFDGPYFFNAAKNKAAGLIA
jgi:3',5'-cyclic AMP phosphodiesterase CpdA